MRPIGIRVLPVVVAPLLLLASLLWASRAQAQIGAGTERLALPHRASKTSEAPRPYSVIRSYYVLDITLPDSSLAAALQSRGIAVAPVVGLQRIICDVISLPALDSMAVPYAIVRPEEQPHPDAPVEAHSSSVVSPAVVHECLSSMGWAGSCIAGTCDFISPEFPGGVDIGCGTLTTSGCRWQFALPYGCAASYSDMDGCFYGGGTTVGDDGPDIDFYNWQTHAYDVIAENVGTSTTWHCGSPFDLAIGKYISTEFHNVVVGIFAHGMDCAYINAVSLCYDYTPKNGILHCTSNPSGAAVTVDGTPKGVTPVDVYVAPGDHTVQMSKGCHTSCEKSATATCGSGTGVSCTLTPLPTAVLSCSSDPSGAAVSIDGIPRGVTPVDVSVTVGVHSVSMSESCYVNSDIGVTAICDKETSAYCALIPMSARVDLTSDPSGASVYENAQFLGTTPFSLSDVAWGDHTYVFRKSDFLDCPQTLSAVCGQTQTAHCPLIACACGCHADPAITSSSPCDGVTDIFDVVTLINEAFRDQAPVPDPNPSCPCGRSDVDGNGAVDILDVIHMINVAFRDGDTAVEFADPCP